MLFKGLFKRSSSIANETSREVWLEKTLKHIPAGCRILDAGAGEQQYRRFCAHLNYVAQDFAEYNGKGDVVGLQMENWDQSNLDIISDIVAIPEPDCSFDAIMCIEVFEHLPNPIDAVKEFSRLLKPEGHLIITAPFCSLTHFSPYHFSSGFNKYWYDHHLVKNGFKIIELQANGNYFMYLAQEVNRIQDVIDKYTDFNLNPLESIIFRLAKKILMLLSDSDRGSDELLCFGYHIHCQKK